MNGGNDPGDPGSTGEGRESRLFHAEWSFHLGDAPGAEQPGFEDERWRVVELPHDWSIEGQFRQFRDEYFAGFQNLDHRVGYLPQGVGWYRKTFHAPRAWAGRSVYLQFDGVYRNAAIWINGEHLGRRPYGYSSFQYELTPHLRLGERNVVAVRVDNAGVSSRWYAGSGIYRPVRLLVTAPLHVAQWGTCVTTPEVSPARARVHVETTIINADEPAPTPAPNPGACVLVSEIFRAGRRVAEGHVDVKLQGRQVGVIQDLEVPAPALWSPTEPALYDLRTTILVDDAPVDVYHTPFGIRTFHFDPAEGFFLNGRSTKFRGVCLHHDNGCLGAKVYPRAVERKLEILRGMGCNAIRTSHNPPSQEFLACCDRMGFMVMDEAFDEWTCPKTPHGYTRHFEAWHERDLVDFIHRDRNHPSVILWSCGNEVPEQAFSQGDRGVEILERLLAIFHREDPTRPVTQGCNRIDDANRTGFAARLDVVGYNYRGDDVVGGVSESEPFTCRYDQEHARYPDRVMIGSENCSAFNTRGVYTYPVPLARWQKERPDGTCTSYDITSEIPLIILATRPYVCGYFAWEGFDYLGEPTPYRWPARSSQFGIVDLCGFPKDSYFLHQSMWTKAPMVHLVPQNWNFHPGMTIPVWAYSNCERVELFLNGQSLGARRMDEYDDLAHVFWDVPYEPGVLRAEAWANGAVVATQEVATAGPPHHLAVTVDRDAMPAHPREIAHVAVSVRDADDRVVPAASTLVTFTVAGPGVIIGVGNGNPVSHEPFCDQQRHCFNGWCLAVVKATGAPGRLRVSAHAPMLAGTAVTVTLGRQERS